MSIYVTGDTHGNWIARLCMESFPEQKEMTKDDFVIILGDFGIWDGGKTEKYDLDWLDTRNFTTLFVDGNHENYDILDNLPVSEWHGGKVHFVRPSVIHLMRGEVYNIAGKTFFAFGGASSHDISDGILEPGDSRVKSWRKDYEKSFRVNHVSWWERELPNQEEMENGLNNLTRFGNNVDYILTHSPYTSLLKQIATYYEKDRLTDFLQEVKETTKYNNWLFGHVHRNQSFPWEKSYCLYEQIVRIE